MDLQRACGLCIPGALPWLGSELRCTDTGGEQLPFCNSWTSAALPSLYPQITFLFWSLNDNNKLCPLRFAYKLRETSSECCDSFSHCSTPRGTAKLLPPVLSFYYAVMWKTSPSPPLPCFGPARRVVCFPVLRETFLEDLQHEKC